LNLNVHDALYKLHFTNLLSGLFWRRFALSECLVIYISIVIDVSEASTVHHRQVMFSVVVVVITVFTTFLVAALVCIYCRYRRVVIVSKVGGGLRSTKRVVVMHSNVLYHGDGDSGGGGKDPDSTVPFLPVVKIEAGVSRLTSQSTMVSEYEIPLDKDWEFPRDK